MQIYSYIRIELSELLMGHDAVQPLPITKHLQRMQTNLGGARISFNHYNDLNINVSIYYGLFNCWEIFLSVFAALDYFGSNYSP